MSRRLLASMTVAVALLAPSLAACGSDSESDGTAQGLAAVSITGDVGSAPKVEWKAEMDETGTETKTLVDGTGPEITKDESVLVGIYLANGYDKKKAFSSYDAGGQPQSIDLSSADQLPIFADALVGQKVGARVAVATNAKSVFSDQGNSSLGIGNRDPILFVLDVLGPYQPTGSYPSTAKGTTPGVKVDKDGKPTALTFAAKKPATKLTRVIVTKGDGPVATKTSTVMVDYLGQVYGAKKPFDESFSKTPMTQPLTGLVKGWQKLLAGVPAGSQVILSIPPKYGYGKSGQPSAGIKGTDTMVFVINLLAVA